jgi:hypothetical protein
MKVFPALQVVQRNEKNEHVVYYFNENLNSFSTTKKCKRNFNYVHSSNPILLSTFSATNFHYKVHAHTQCLDIVQKRECPKVFILHFFTVQSVCQTARNRLMNLPCLSILNTTCHSLISPQKGAIFTSRR